MVDYLSNLGDSLSKIRNFDYWYLSPLREEKTPSFKINRKLNCWYDHGICKGGNLIDFAILYCSCTVGEFLQKVNGYFSFHQPVSVRLKENAENTESKIEIISERTISSLTLERYLTYQLNDKEYFGIGFKNDSGGYELRNQYYKASSSPKDIKTFAVVLGSPGAGKSYFVIRHVITLHIKKGFTRFIYDFKFDDLANQAGHTRHYSVRNGKGVK